MLPFKTLLFLPLLFPCTFSYKMVLFVPDMANSQVLFNSRVAEALAKAGNDVTMVMISGMSDFDSKDVKIMKEVKLHRVNASFGMSRKELQERQSKIHYEDIPVWDSRVRENLRQMTGLLIKSCRKLVENKEFLEWLAGERFDLAFSHMYDICPIGLIHYAKIPSWIWLNSGALMDFVAYYMGVPIIPSYMPPIAMESSDHMNFLERTKSFIGHMLTSLLWKRNCHLPEKILPSTLMSMWPLSCSRPRKHILRICPDVRVAEATACYEERWKTAPRFGKSLAHYTLFHLLI
ncbi:hypothetical protein Y032_0552g3339 [Ancylostoma ceylanicum]|uniref:glucuronosyltransferase n=1 Tax=Ancylostoma ceylanicum TaxID=53326 RepID=A0A016WS73_9BILA|nr:hypothetical protein Y032_0552g3339 [Ancylostoma ceylanicum]